MPAIRYRRIFDSISYGGGITAGGTDLVLFVDAPMGDNIAKVALALGSAGNVHTRTGRAWTEAEFLKIVSELP
jgi:uncharacterized protein with GYD domain